jgi:hypothetical protein
LYQNPKFDLRQAYFTDSEAAIFKDQKNILLISDIRNGDIDNETDVDVQLIINQDMRDQERWYRIIKPKSALFKFRLPYVFEGNPLLNNKQTYTYLDGNIRIQAYARQTSAEGRLIPNGKNKEWNTEEYEDLYMTHNIYRAARYEHEEIEGLDHCFDCSLEVQLWKNYIKKYNSKNTVQDLVDLLNKNLAGGKFNPITYPSKKV